MLSSAPPNAAPLTIIAYLPWTRISNLAAWQSRDAQALPSIVEYRSLQGALLEVQSPKDHGCISERAWKPTKPAERPVLIASRCPAVVQTFSMYVEGWLGLFLGVIPALEQGGLRAELIDPANAW